MKTFAISLPFVGSLGSRKASRPGPLARLHRMMALRRSRQHLAELPDYLIADIGLTRQAVVEEAQRPFWDAPDHWKRMR